MSSWDYPSFNRSSSSSSSSHRLGDFERIDHRNESKRRVPPNYRRFDKGMNDLPLPRPGHYGSGSWDRLPAAKSSSPPPPKKQQRREPDVAVVDLVDEDEEPKKEDPPKEKEELFPPNKVALLQNNLSGGDLIGLEYIIEVQDSSAAGQGQPPVYCCLLCGERTKPADTLPASQHLIKSHLQSTAHKVNYIETYFPTLKKLMLSKIQGGSKSSAYREALSRVCRKINSTFGRMNIKIVIGLRLFERRQEEIKNMINNSTHFRENKDFVDLVLGGNQADLEDSYEKAFSDFEAELRKKNSRDKHRSHESSRDHKGRGSRDSHRYRSRKSRSRSPRNHNDERKSSSRNSFDSVSSDSFDRKPRSAATSVVSPRGEDESGSSSKKSLSKRKTSEERSHQQSTSYRPMSRTVEKDIERYIEKEKALNETLHSERREYLNFPHTHQDYNEEWEKFYVEITSKRGISDTEVINREWIEHWKAFFFASFDAESTKRREQLLVDHHITSRDLDHYYSLKSRSLEKQVESKVSSREEDDSKDVTVISTFRLLSALENILDELGPTVIRLLAKANSMEVNEGFGSSSAMIHEEEVFALLWKAKEKLDYKISNDIIDGNQVPASKVLMSNIGVLINKSKCELPLEPSNPNLSNEISIRAGIAKTVVEQFDAQGKMITESQLANIVEMQYARYVASSSSRSSKPTEASGSGGSNGSSSGKNDGKPTSIKPVEIPNREEYIQMTPNQRKRARNRMRARGIPLHDISRERILSKATPADVKTDAALTSEDIPKLGSCGYPEATQSFSIQPVDILNCEEYIVMTPNKRKRVRNRMSSQGIPPHDISSEGISCKAKPADDVQTDTSPASEDKPKSESFKHPKATQSSSIKPVEIPTREEYIQMTQNQRKRARNRMRSRGIPLYDISKERITRMANPADVKSAPNATNSVANSGAARGANCMTGDHGISQETESKPDPICHREISSNDLTAEEHQGQGNI